MKSAEIAMHGRNFCKVSTNHVLVQILKGDALQSLCPHLLKLKGKKIPQQEALKRSFGEHQWWEAGLCSPSPGQFLPAPSWAGKRLSEHPPPRHQQEVKLESITSTSSSDLFYKPETCYSEYAFVTAE